MDLKANRNEVFEIHEDPRVCSLADLENVCVLYGHNISLWDWVVHCMSY